MGVLGSLYGAGASWRRRWYASQPGRVRRLNRPVVSVGNLRAGGRGKTPVVRFLVEQLLALGERPAVLTRGYGRPDTRQPMVVVSDGRCVLADYATAGDEPLMLARALPRAIVIVGADRYASGRHAEHALGATVHVLDDGFQHVSLGRDVDLLLVDADDLRDSVIPDGRLREPLAAASLADALLTTTDSESESQRIATALGVRTHFRVERRLGALSRVDGGLSTPSDARVLAVAGIALPDRFFADLRASGVSVADAMAFRDHHTFSAHDVAQMLGRAAAIGAHAIVTTEKDAVRLDALWAHQATAATGDASLPALVVAPLTASVVPQSDFLAWLRPRLAR